MANLHYSFDTVIITDETTVQLESHRWYIYIATEKLERNLALSPGQNIQQKSTCGQGLVKGEQREYAYLKVQWILNYFVKY